MLLSLQSICFCFGALLSGYLFFCFSLELFILFYSPISFSLLQSPSRALFKSFRGNNSGKYAKYRGLEIDTDVVFHEENDGIPNVVCSETISGTGLTDFDEFQGLLYVVDLKHGSDSVLIVLKYC